MDPISLRFLERILAVAVGGLCIYLGYRLFINLPENTDSQGKFVLPGNISIYLSRVGPGVFFALFGASIVALALYKGVTYQAGPAPAVSQTAGKPAVVADSGYSTSLSGSVSGQQVNPAEDRS